MSELELSNAKSAFLPSLDLTSTHGLGANRPQSVTSPWSSSLGLSLTQNIYDNHKSIFNFQIQDFKQQAALATLRQAKNHAAVDCPAATRTGARRRRYRGSEEAPTPLRLHLPPLSL